MVMNHSSVYFTILIKIPLYIVAKRPVNYALLIGDLPSAFLPLRLSFLTISR